MCLGSNQQCCVALSIRSLAITDYVLIFSSASKVRYRDVVSVTFYCFCGATIDGFDFKTKIAKPSQRRRLFVPLYLSVRSPSFVLYASVQ